MSVFKRIVPGFGISADEIKERAEDGAPAELIAEAVRCTQAEADDRPELADVVERLTGMHPRLFNFFFIADRILYQLFTSKQPARTMSILPPSPLISSSTSRCPPPLIAIAWCR